jgi:ribosome-dependent ATPase
MMRAAMPTGVIAQLFQVTQRYGTTNALADISIAIPAGRMVGVIGPDGVGKSTLLALIAGVRKLQSGSVCALGGDMASAAHRRAVCARIAYMPQGLGRNLYPTLSVVENIDFFGRLFGQSGEERRWRINELLASTGLTAFADRPAGKLSGGMKQKLALCCALVHDPDLLILDEPTTGVDPLARRQFWELIDRIRSRRLGMSVLVATAYMEEAARFDHLIAMDEGRVLAEGSAAELKARTGTTTLEQAFIALLPAHKRLGHKRPFLPQRPVKTDIPAIEAHELTHRFGAFTAVDRVTVSIAAGEIFGFLGSNGCGKTTTMKMLTGLLPLTEGTAALFGKPIDARDIATRRRVGYMSQSFSLYSELTVRQNLDLHADLFQLGAERGARRVAAMLSRFGLETVADQLPEVLPLGVKQRLQLAVAVLHEPEILILDEPTSGVDPIARDSFWNLLIELSRKDGVTIFISTHFINEAERCDRVSLMHAGKLLAVDTPEALRARRGVDTLEAAFIGYLEAATSNEPAGRNVDATRMPAVQKAATPRGARWLDTRRLLAFARREMIELLRDKIRLAFALIGPVVLLTALSFGLSFDVENVRYGVFDQDQSAESRTLLETFANSRYFKQQPAIQSPTDLDQRIATGELKFALVISPGFGRDLVSGRTPDIGVWLDGANTFRAETSRGYVQGVLQGYMLNLAGRETGRAAQPYPATIETRFRYNQAFLSLHAIAPGALMMLLIMVPAMLTALGVVREKELGSITNLYAAPVSRLEFLIGKQLPYIAVAFLSFVGLVALIHWGFGVPITGSLLALALGALLYATAATAFGLVVSTFVNSQIAAIFATSIIVMIPTVNFSGMLYPVSALTGAAKVMGQLFPASYFQRVSSGVFNKGLGVADLLVNYLALAAFCLVFWALAAMLLKKQEA